MSAIDIIVWIVILGVVAAGIVIAIHYGSDIRTASDVHAEQQNTAALVSDIRQAFQGYPDYSSLSDSDLINAKAVPSAITVSGTSLSNVFGNPITLAMDSSNSNAFDLTDEVPNAACAAIANSVLKNVTSLTINGSAITLPVTDPATIGQACGTSNPVSIVEVYSGM
ncbi:MAG: type 4 pilus major pilin [Steroidobacteraceae bacterium]